MTSRSRRDDSKRSFQEHVFGAKTQKQQAWLKEKWERVKPLFPMLQHAKRDSSESFR